MACAAFTMPLQGRHQQEMPSNSCGYASIELDLQVGSNSQECKLGRVMMALQQLSTLRKTLTIGVSSVMRAKVGPGRPGIQVDEKPCSRPLPFLN